MSDDIVKRAMEWLISQDTGASSESIMAYMLAGIPPKSYPLDPSDLGRCLRLLRRIPEWACRISELACGGKVWSELAANWDELSTIMTNEVGIDWEKGRNAPNTYKRMREITSIKEKAE